MTNYIGVVKRNGWMSARLVVLGKAKGTESHSRRQELPPITPSVPGLPSYLSPAVRRADLSGL